MQESDKTLLSSAGWLAEHPPRRWHLLLAGACIAAVYLIGVTGRWWPTPDSALYLGLARSLAAGEGYRFNGSAHNIVTPGLPLILAGLRIVFGAGFWAPNFFMALCGLVSIFFIYMVIARLSNPRLALAVTLATAMSYTFFNQSHRILTDAPFAAIFWAILYAYIRYRSGSARWLILVGLLSMAAIVVRIPGILFLASLAIAVIPDRGSTGLAEVPPGRKNRKGLVAACVILAIVAVLGAGFFIAARSAAEGVPIYARAIISKAGVGLTMHLRYIGLGLIQLPLTFSEMLTSQETYFIGLPALLLVIVGAVNLWRCGQKFVLPLIFMSVLALAICGRNDAVRPRYLLPIHPLLVLAMMEGLCWSIKRFSRSAGEKLLPKTVTVLVGLIIACNAPKLLRNAVYYSYLSHTSRYYQVVHDGQFPELINVAEVIRLDHPDDKSACREQSQTASTNSDEVSILHFLSRRLIVRFTIEACPKKHQSIQQKAAYKAKAIYKWIGEHPKVEFVAINVDTTVKNLVREQEDNDGKPVDEQAKSAARKEFIQRLKLHLLDLSGFNLVYEGQQYHVYQRATQTKRGSVSFRNETESLRKFGKVSQLHKFLFTNHLRIPGPFPRLFSKPALAGCRRADIHS